MLTLAILGSTVLAVIGAFGSTMDKGGWAAKAAAETGPVSMREARKRSFGGQLEALMNFAGKNGKFLFFLTLAGAAVLIEVAVITIEDLARFATVALEGLARVSIVVVTEAAVALVVVITAVGAFVYDHRAEIWDGIKTSCYYSRELIALIADLLTIATVGAFGAVRLWAIDWWQSQ